MSRAPTIAVIGTLDTKSQEIRYVRDRIVHAGLGAFVIDSGILGEPTLVAEVPRTQVAASAGKSLDEVQQSGSRGAAVQWMQQGLQVLLRQYYEQGRVQGVLCLGGAEGGLLGAAAMQGLPVGVPKLIVSPAASGRREFGPFMGSRDVIVMHSVIDILGLNAVARSVYDNAVAAIVGMAVNAGALPARGRTAVGMTMLGQTTPGAMVVARHLEDAGYEPVIFHANGIGGPAMDDFVDQGLFSGVLDFTVSELANTLFDGLHATGPDRMTAAVRAQIPLLVVPGAGDFFNQGPLDTVPERYRSRSLYHHNPVATLVRLEAAEMRQLGELIAQRLSGARGPTEVVVPTRGLSLIGVPGGEIADAEADTALVEALRDYLPGSIALTVVEEAINSEAFASEVSRRFVNLMSIAGTDSGGASIHR